MVYGKRIKPSALVVISDFGVLLESRSEDILH
jgi:hypothetical protein